MKKLVLILLLAVPVLISAQGSYYNDAQLRLSLGVEKHFGKHFSLAFDNQERLYQNFTDLTRISNDLGLVYKFNKHVKIRLGYELITKKNKYGYYQNRNWYYGSLMLKHSVGKWDFVYRNMVQARMYPQNSDNASIVKYYDRNKLTIRYEANRRMDLWVAEEIYIPLNNMQSKGIDRTRSYLGTTIRLAKKQSLDLYFMFQAQLQRGKWYDQSYQYQNDPLNHYYVYGISYNLDL